VNAGVSSVGPSPRRRENATFVMLASNSDVDGAAQSVQEMEDRFNKKYNYPWVFLNDEEYSEEFKACAQALFILPFVVLTEQPKSRFDSRIGARLLRADPCRSLAPTFVDR
jgi:hypothetical protein